MNLLAYRAKMATSSGVTMSPGNSEPNLMRLISNRFSPMASTVNPPAANISVLIRSSSSESIPVPPARGDTPAHEHFDARFALQATTTEDFQVSTESHALAWVPIDELEKFTREPSLLRMRGKWYRMRR